MPWEQGGQHQKIEQFPPNCQKEGLLAVLRGVGVGNADGAWSVRLCDLKTRSVCGWGSCLRPLGLFQMKFIILLML